MKKKFQRLAQNRKIRNIFFNHFFQQESRATFVKLSLKRNFDAGNKELLGNKLNNLYSKSKRISILKFGQALTGFATV